MGIRRVQSAAALALVVLVAVASMSVSRELTPPVAAGNPCVGPVPMAFGDTASCSIDSLAENDAYSFVANSNDRVFIRVVDQADPIEPAIRVFRPNASELVACAVNGVTESVILCTLDASGTHTILVSDQSGDDTGAYTIFIQRTNAPGNSEDVDLGSTSSIPIPLGSFVTRTADADAGEVLIGRLADADGPLTPELRLYRPNGELLCSGTATTLTEVICPVPATGTYTLLAGDVGGTDAGNLYLHVRPAADPALATAIEFGDTTAGLLIPAELDAFAFQGVSAHTVLVRVVDLQGDIEPSVRVISPSGSVKCTATATTLAELVCVLTEGGAHLILVGDSFGEESGAFAVHIQSLNAPLETTPITVGQTVGAHLALLSETDTYAFEAPAPLSLVVTVFPGPQSLGAHVRVYDAFAQPVCQATSLTLVQIQCGLSQAGVYSIVVASDFGNDTGNYAVNLQCVGCAFPADIDGDGASNAADNCPTIPNAGQQNTDELPLSTPASPALDTSIVYGDGLGDACDVDDDNDWLFDDRESSFCIAGAGDPLVADTDGDRVRDGAECLGGSSPADPASRPIVNVDPDADGIQDALEQYIGVRPDRFDTDSDGIGDGIEFFGYSATGSALDSDSDGCDDGLEFGSLDGASAVNSLDLLLVAQQFGRVDRPVQDVNKDGNVNALDLLLVARQFDPTGCVA